MTGRVTHHKAVSHVHVHVKGTVSTIIGSLEKQMQDGDAERTVAENEISLSDAKPLGADVLMYGFTRAAHATGYSEVFRCFSHVV